MLKNAKIGMKLLALVGFMALLLAGVGTYLLVTISSINTQSRENLNLAWKITQAVNYSDATTIHFKKQVQDWKDTLLRGNKPADFDKYHGLFLTQEADVTKTLQKLKKSMQALNLDTSQVDKFANDHAELGVAYRKALAHYDKKNYRSYHIVDTMVRGIDRKPTDVINSVAGAMMKNEVSLFSELNDKAATQYRTALYSSMAAIALGVVLIFLTSFFFIRSLTRPLNEIVDVASLASRGDFSSEIRVKRADEIGSLADAFRALSAYLKEVAGTAEEIAGGDLRSEVEPKSERDVLGNAFKRMISGLRGIITEVKTGADQMSSASTQIATTAEQSARNNEAAATAVEETTATMHEMSANIQNVAKNTQSQSSSVTETSASIEQMVTSIDRIAGTARQLIELSQKTNKAVVVGMESVEKSVKGTDETNRAIARSADTIAALGSRAEDIGKIVDVIDDIAEQTNLLALNAAIEAARAGEQGLGFAVVAEEVRKLAERSAKSTKEIAELIAGIQREAQDAVKLMDKSTELVEKGVELGRQVGDSLKDIDGGVAEVDRYAKEIGAATQEQSGGSTQIAKAAESLMELTQEISSAAEEQASAAEQIVKTTEKMREMIHQNASGSAQLASSAEQLNSQADRFQEIVGRFLLDGGSGDGGAFRPSERTKAAAKGGGNGSSHNASKEHYAEVG